MLEHLQELHAKTSVTESLGPLSHSNHCNATQGTSWEGSNSHACICTGLGYAICGGRSIQKRSGQSPFHPASLFLRQSSFCLSFRPGTDRGSGCDVRPGSCRSVLGLQESSTVYCGQLPQAVQVLSCQQQTTMGQKLQEPLQTRES